MVYLADMEGYAYWEIAQATGMPIGTVRSRLHRARRQLRDLLSGHPDASRPTAPAPTRHRHFSKT